MTEPDDSLEQRPSQDDFDPYHGDLDALHAWKNFGGLSRSEAYEKFCENALYYQEAFMFMGGVAFAYYFPVIERYIRDCNLETSDEMWILAHCLISQVDNGSVGPSLRERMLALAEHVRQNVTRYDHELAEQLRIDNAWEELESKLRSA